MNSLSLPSGFKIDPLDISSLLPAGLVHVDEEGSYYAADLWMWNITLTGLTQAYLNEVGKFVVGFIFHSSHLLGQNYQE